MPVCFFILSICSIWPQQLLFGVLSSCVCWIAEHLRSLTPVLVFELKRFSLFKYPNGQNIVNAYEEKNLLTVYAFIPV